MSLALFGGLTSTLRNLILGAYQVGDDLDATLITRHGTTAELGAYTPDLGELVYDEDLETLLIGDGGTAYGLPINFNLNSPTSILVVPNAGTQVLCGDLLRNAVNAAKVLTPYGNARDVYNRPIVGFMPGVYDIDGGAADLLLDTEFCDLVGLGSCPEECVIKVGTTRKFEQSSNDCRLANFTVYNTASSGGFKMSNAAGHPATIHDNLRFVNSGGTTTLTHAYSTWTNLGGIYRRCRSTHPGMYGSITDGLTCNANFEDCHAPFGSLGSSISNTQFVNFSGRHSRCRSWANNATLSPSITCILGAVIEYGNYNGAGGATALRAFKVTGATTPGPMFQFNTIISGGSSPFAIDRKDTETGQVLFATHNRFPVNGITTNLTNGAGADAAAFNIANAGVIA